MRITDVYIDKYGSVLYDDIDKYGSVLYDDYHPTRMVEEHGRSKNMTKEQALKEIQHLCDTTDKLWTDDPSGYGGKEVVEVSQIEEILDSVKEQGIKVKDIEEFEKLCCKLNDLMVHIHEYQPEVLLYVSGEGTTSFNLCVGFDDDDGMAARSETIITQVDVSYADCGGF